MHAKDGMRVLAALLMSVLMLVIISVERCTAAPGPQEGAVPAWAPVG